MARFLRALCGSDVVLPPSLEERAELFRMRVAGRRVLIVLDNASTEQVLRPLLPGGSGCGVIITSRGRLPGLSGVDVIELGELDDDGAEAMLSRIIGPDRVANEATSARTILRLCGGLPLAVRVAGARLAARPYWPLSRLADRLSDERRRLDELALGDLAVRASIGVTYQGLGRDERRALHLVAVLGVPDFASWLVDALLGESETDAEELLDRLVETRLLDVTGIDAAGQVRYRCHDLIRAFARERANADEHDVAAAVERALRACVGLARLAASRTPRRNPRSLPLPVVRSDFDPPAAVTADPTGWLLAETNTLVAAVEAAGALELDELAVVLAATLVSSEFAARNLFDAWWRTHNVALATSRRSGNRTSEALILAQLGQLRYEQDRFEEARSYLAEGLAAFRAVGDPAGEVDCLLALATVCRELAEFEPAMSALEQAQSIAMRAGLGARVAEAWLDVGAVHRDQGRYGAAESAFQQALAAFRTFDDRRGEAMALRGVSLVHRARGELEQSSVLAEQALDILQARGDTIGVVYAMQSLSKTRIRQGRGDEVEQALRMGLLTCRRMGDRFGQALVRRTLGELALATGRLREAREELRASLVLWTELGLDIWRARVLRDLGAVHASVHRESAARAAWADAALIFGRLGAREARERPTWPDLVWRPGYTKLE